MPVLSERQIAALVRQYLDEARMLAEHPELSRAQLDAFWQRLGLKPAAQADLFAPARPTPPRAKRRQRAGEHLVVVARCDGAARGNPGPAAIGGVIEDEDGQGLMDFGECIGETTCNVAEYKAVIRAIEKALELGATEITLRLDSQLLTRQLQGRYRVKAPHLRPLHQQALGLLGRFKRWEVVEVSRGENAAADRLANRALDRQRRGETKGDA